MIRVVICDDQDVVREGLRSILHTAPGIEVVGVAEDGVAAVDVVSRTRPDVALMDLHMPHMTGIQATRVIRQQCPAVRVLILTTYDADEWVLGEILRLLARGMANSEIAAQVLLSEGTVRNNVSQICAKLGVADRIQAAVLAMRHGLAD